MDFTEYQKRANKTAIYPRDRGLIYTVLGLESEAGEIAGKVKKWIRKDTSYDEMLGELIEEIGDIVWYVAQLCTELDFSLEEIVKVNIAKLEDRQMRNVLQGSGDKR